MGRAFRLAAALAAAAAAAALSGCANGPSDVSINDTAFIPSGRLSVPIFAGKPSGLAPTTPQSGHAIEATYTGIKGSDRQELEAGDDDVIFEGTTFTQPVDLRHDYSFRYGEAVYRWRKFFGASQNFGMEVLGGVGHGIFYVTVDGGAQGAASQKYNSTGLVLGLGGIWRFRPDTSLQLRFSGMGGGGRNEVNASRFDLHLVHAVSRNVAVRGGLTSWHISVPRSGSDVEASSSGPALALDINF